ncbi:porin [Daeguia caeni]|uniref:Porin n=1 Tax=Daeguia caeni TaxID=439612 RepID=A0ABV9H822_9HYPH
MNMKSLLLGSAAALVAATGAQAADAVVAPEPEAVEYVRVCDAYGAGYFYIPGTETCLRIHGYVRYDVRGGDDVYNGWDREGWDKRARFALRVSTGTETELGTLKTYTELRFNYEAFASGHDGYYGYTTSGTVMEFAYITLGGFKVGIDESEFHIFTGGLGDVINDDVVAATPYRTGKIAYNFDAGNGFSAVVALEEGADNYIIDGYVPHILGGVKYQGGWGKIAGIAAYDSVIEDWSGKIRADVNITDQFSIWAQGAYSGDETPLQNFGQWGGNWAVWGGFKYKATQQASFNFQAAYEEWGKTALTANVAYELVPGFTITPEVSFTKWDRDHPYRVEAAKEDIKIKDAWGGIIRFQRSF